MERLKSRLRTLGLLAVLPLAACSVDVREDANRNADVDIRTPVGNVSVQSNGAAPDTGLPAYPGATLLREGDEPESANVNVGAFGVGVRVSAAKFESSDGEAAVLDFYRKAMEPNGPVMECRGEVDFRDSGPVCESRGSDRDVQLVTGTKNNQRIVAVKPRGTGSEIALVHVQVRGVD
jgi:hypothetical protein